MAEKGLVRKTTAERLDELYPFVPMDPDDREHRVDWLAEGLLMEGRINVVFGMEKSGKSRFLAWLLCHLVSGQPFAGAGVRDPSPILYVAGEEVRQEVTARLLDYQETLGFPAVDWGEAISFVEASGMRLEREDQRAWLRKRVEDGGFRTMIVDPLRRVHAASEGSNDEMAPVCNALREWSNQLGLSVVVVHHTGKLGLEDDETRIATWSRGATDLPAVLDWALYVRRAENPGSAPDRIQIQRKGRAPKRGPISLLDRGDHFEWLREEE